MVRPFRSTRRLAAAVVVLSTATTSLFPLRARAAELPFIADDLQGALAQARDRHQPIFIEAWAPW